MLPMALGPVSPDQTNVRSIGSSSPRISTKRRRHQSPGGTVPPFADLPFADLLFADLPFADIPFADPPIVATCGAWELLPNEVILRVLAHCAAAELCQLAYTATLLRDLSGSDRLWRRLFRAQFPETVPISSDGDRMSQNPPIPHTPPHLPAPTHCHCHCMIVAHCGRAARWRSPRLHCCCTTLLAASAAFGCCSAAL
eukprot:COSAG01_NODE_2598_length_7399_cov_4.972740_1_plen_198_part_00